jgi:hypothetical protein
MALGSVEHDSYGINCGRCKVERANNSVVEIERDDGTRRDTPFDIDTIVIIGRGNPSIRQCSRSAKMEVRGRSCRVVMVFRVEMQEGRFQKSPEQSGNT